MHNRSNLIAVSSNDVAAFLVAERHAQSSEAERKVPTAPHKRPLIQNCRMRHTIAEDTSNQIVARVWPAVRLSAFGKANYSVIQSSGTVAGDQAT